MPAPAVRRPAATARVVAAVIGAAAFVVSVSSCGGSDVVLDQADLSAAVADAVAADIDHEVTDVSCAAFDELVSGASVVCFASVAGRPTSFDVVLVDADAGSVSVDNREALVEVADLEADIASDLAAQVGRPVDADCGPGLVRPQAFGSVFICSVRGEGGDVSRVEVVVGATGTDLSWHLVE